MPLLAAQLNLPTNAGGIILYKNKRKKQRMSEE